MATTYTQTDNLGLDLYGDNDPADLRDGYNASMRKIDSAVKANADAIASKADKATTYSKTDVDGKLSASLAQQTNVKKDLLFAHFLSNDKRLFLGISHDGYRFDDIPFAYAPSGGNVRDPSIAIINNQIYVVHTQQQSGLDQYAIGLAIFDFGLNLLSSTVITPNVAGDRAWAPEFFCDPTTGEWYIICSLRTDGSFHPYYSSLATPNLFSPMSANNAISGIDWTVQVNEGMYYLLGVGVNAAGVATKSMVVYASTSWQNFDNTPTNTLPELRERTLEGFTAFRLDNGNWRIVGDAGGYITPMPSDSELYYFDMTPDFSTMVSPYKHLDARGRHGTIIPLTVPITSSIIPQRSVSTTYSAFFNQRLSTITKDPEWTLIPWDTRSSTLSYASPAVESELPTTEISVTEGGLYLLSCYVAFLEVVSSVQPLIGVAINGDFSKVIVGAYTAQIPGVSAQVGGGFTIPIRLNYGDTVSIGCQNKNNSAETQPPCWVSGGVSFVSLTKVG